MRWTLLAVTLAITACGGGAAATAPDGGDGGAADDAAADAASDAAADASLDAGDGAVTCTVSGNRGTCITVSACAALPGYTATPGLCPGPATIQCCAPTPNVANNPPIPTGWKLMQQAQVTPAMTTWAVAILRDPVTYPMFSTAMMTFGVLPVLARVEWHVPDFQNHVVHRGVTLYQPR